MKKTREFGRNLTWNLICSYMLNQMIILENFTYADLMKIIFGLNTIEYTHTAHSTRYANVHVQYLCCVVLCFRLWAIRHMQFILLDETWNTQYTIHIQHTKSHLIFAKLQTLHFEFYSALTHFFVCLTDHSLIHSFAHSLAQSLRCLHCVILHVSFIILLFCRRPLFLLPSSYPT